MHYETPVPFGQDRLIPIWVATLSVQQKSRAIHFSSAAEILDFFDLPKDGPHYRRMVEGFQRVFAATIFFGTRGQVKGATFIEMARFQFFDRMKLWFNTEEQNPPIARESFENTIMLSEAFYNEISAHPIPVERTVISALANAPGVLDFYMWLVWRSWTIRSGAISVPLVAERGLNEQLGSKNYTEPRYFRAKVKTWLRQVKVLRPECPADLSSNGYFIEIHSSRANPPIHSSVKSKTN